MSEQNLQAEDAMNQQIPEPFVDIEAAAKFLGVKVSYLYEECRLGRIPSYKLGKFRRFRLSELERWANSRRDGPPDASSAAPAAAVTAAIPRLP